MAAERVLLVEDDPVIGSELVTALTGYGFSTVWASDGQQALNAATTPVVADLVLLDLGLPDIEGIPLCRRLRSAMPKTVIVVLTARTAELDVVLALEAGADDYLTKPFRLAELMARLRAHLRRRPTPPELSTELVIGSVRLDAVTRRAYVSGTELELRPKEFDLLAVLMASAGQAVSRERLMDEVWDENWFGSTKTLDVHVSGLRRKLSERGDRPDRITTLRRFGYRYEAGN